MGSLLSLLILRGDGSLAASSQIQGALMWIQIIKTRVKTGKDEALVQLEDQLAAIEQPDSGLVRTTMARDQKDPNTVYMIVTFESEEKARAREADPRRQEGLAGIRDTMMEIFDGPPEFIDLVVVAERTAG